MSNAQLTVRSNQLTVRSAQLTVRSSLLTVRSAQLTVDVIILLDFDKKVEMAKFDNISCLYSKLVNDFWLKSNL